MIDSPDIQNLLAGLLKGNEKTVEVNSTVFTPDILASIARANLATQAKVENLISGMISNPNNYCGRSSGDYLQFAQTLSILRNISLTYVPKV